MAGVFISYRGDDSLATAALIDRELAGRFGRDVVFLDCRSIELGIDFADELIARLLACSVLLVVIGPSWLTLTDIAGRRRLDDPRDWVHREIVEALAKGLRVVPVLLDGVRMPSDADLPGELAALSRRQYVVLRRRHADEDLSCLADKLANADLGLMAASERDLLRPERYETREFFRDLIDGHTRLFAGRHAESAQILEYVRDRASGYVFVEGLSGYGKTSLLADLVKQHPGFRYHFISQAFRRTGGGFDPTSGEDVLECLCEQLDPGHVRGQGRKNLERQFRGLVTRPPKQPTVVVLDAVDELDPPDELRTLLPRQLPAGLVFVISGRSQGDRSCLADIGLAPADLGLHLRLGGLDEVALVDLLRIAGGAATLLADDAEFVREVHRVSEGDPFYVRFLVEDAASGVLTRDNVDRTPSGLEGYLDQQLEQLNRSAHRAEHVVILSLLLEAGTLSAKDLCELVDGVNWLNLDAIVREIHRFLLVHRRIAPGSNLNWASEEYSFCHDRFRQYFRGRGGKE